MSCKTSKAKKMEDAVTRLFDFAFFTCNSDEKNQVIQDGRDVIAFIRGKKHPANRAVLEKLMHLKAAQEGLKQAISAYPHFSERDPVGLKEDLRHIENCIADHAIESMCSNDLRLCCGHDR